MKQLLRLSALMFFLALAACAAPSGRKAADTPVVVTQVPLDYFNDSTASGYLTSLKEAGVSVVLVSATDIFQTGAEREALMDRLHDALAFFREGGFEVGVWTSSLGYGYPVPAVESRYPGRRHLTDFNGATSGAYCATDTLFRDLIRQNVQDFARAGARFILMDDDLVQSVRPGFTCVCEGHLAMMEEATGRAFSREQVRDLFTGAPNEDRNTFLDVMGKSMMDFCRVLRDAVDEIDPDIVMAICSSYTHFDAEGVDMAELSELLAGKGHQAFLRLSGATYWPNVAPRFPGESLGDVTDFVRMQIGWYRDRDIILFDENDPYPRDSKIVPASWCELYDKIMMANGGVNRHKYMFCFKPVSPEKAYLDAHMANLQDDKTLLGMFKGTVPCGFRVWNSEHLLRDVRLPDTYPGNGPMMVLASHSAAAVFLGANSIPVCFEGTGGPGIVFGDQARLLPPEAIGSGLILDVPAAKALAERGIDVGLSSALPLPVPEEEAFNGTTETFSATAGSFYGLVPREGIDATVMSEFVIGGERFPSCLVCKTADGVFAIYGWDGYSMLTAAPRPWNAPERAEQLEAIYREMAGGDALPARVTGGKDLYLLVAGAPDADRRAVLLCNMGGEEATGIRLALPAGWTVTRALRTEAGVATDPSGLPAFTLPPVPAWDWCALVLEKR